MSHQNFISLRTIHGCEMYQIRTWYDHSHYHYTSHLLQTTEYHYHYCIIISFMRHVSEFSILGSVFATVTQTTHMFTYHSPINIYSMIRTSTESSCPWILGKAPQDIPSCFGELNATLRRPIQIRNFVNFLALDCSNTLVREQLLCSNIGSIGSHPWRAMDPCELPNWNPKPSDMGLPRRKLGRS
jgi:hypothetical protein